MIDLSKITTNGKALYLAYDQGMEHGPSDFDDESVDPNYILSIGIEGKFNGVIFQKGVAEKYYESALHNELPLIVKLNGKTNLVKEEPFAPLLCSVDEAIKLGAVAVGYTVYVGSLHENEMTSQLARIVASAHEKGLPVIAWMYPRGKSIENKTEEEIIPYASRLGLELGADIIKIKYPGNVQILQKSVEAAGKTKVVVSGGEKESEEEFLVMAKESIASGVIGMAVGRNIWQNKDPLGITEKLKKIIFD